MPLEVGEMKLAHIALWARDLEAEATFWQEYSTPRSVNTIEAAGGKDSNRVS